MKESRYNVWVERGDEWYLYNGVSGGLLRVTRQERSDLERFLASPGSEAEPAKVLSEMVRGRMLLRDGFDELALLQRRYETSRHGREHFALTLVTSLGCNFDCPYCFEAKHPSIMRPNVQEAILDLLDEKLPGLQSFRASWFGGEPLVGKQALFDLSDAFIARCDSAGVHYAADITTNGYLLDEATCEALRDRRVGRAQVSLDGPPEIHDRMRPLVSGRGTFWAIVRNLKHAIDYLPVAVRINVDKGNFTHASELLEILAGEGFVGKLTVYIGQLVGIDGGDDAPSTTYGMPCFTNAEFATAQLEFAWIAQGYGFDAPASLPTPIGAPCTAVRANELVVGSNGELYKCYESVGDPREVIGNIRHHVDSGGRLAKWLKYDPFADQECKTCIALPVCMGGCASHAMDPALYDNRCDTFRHTHREQILRFVADAEAGRVTASHETMPRMEKAR